MSDAQDKYYFNVRTGEVELGIQSDWPNRMGPYETYEQAARALELARERTQAWDEQERAWRDADPAGTDQASTQVARDTSEGGGGSW